MKVNLKQHYDLFGEKSPNLYGIVDVDCLSPTEKLNILKLAFPKNPIKRIGRSFFIKGDNKNGTFSKKQRLQTFDIKLGIEIEKNVKEIEIEDDFSFNLFIARVIREFPKVTPIKKWEFYNKNVALVKKIGDASEKMEKIINKAEKLKKKKKSKEKQQEYEALNFKRLQVHLKLRDYENEASLLNIIGIEKGFRPKPKETKLVLD